MDFEKETKTPKCIYKNADDNTPISNTVEKTTAIHAKINGNYDPKGPITHKYKPLEGIKFTVGSADQLQFCALAKDRISIYNKIGIDIKLLTFLCENEKEIKAKETDTNALPPLVVVSSGRSRMIKTAELEGRPGEHVDYNGVENLDPLKKIPVPIYVPYRQKTADRPRRRTYIFVHESEYETYANDLKDTGMTVIGWCVGNYVLADQSKRTTTPHTQCYGFGAMRYAVIEFFKYMDVKSIWMIDDNVVYVKHFPEFEKIEAKFQVTGPNDLWIGVGFEGASKGTLMQVIANLGTENTSPNKRKPGTVDFLQQMTLWNIAKLKTEKINFSPYFLSAQEDSSFTKYVSINFKDKDKDNGPCWQYKGSTIVKSVPRTNGATQSSSIRDINFKRMSKQLYEMQNSKIATNKTIKALLLKEWPNAKDGTNPKELASLTFSKALEQIFSESIGSREVLLPSPYFTHEVPETNITIITPNSPQS